MVDAGMKFITVVSRSGLISEVNHLRRFLLPDFSVGKQDGVNRILSLLLP